MKRVFLSLFLMLDLVCAKESYEKAYKDYSDKNYQKSYDGLKILVQKEPGNKNINYYLGRSAFELGKYEEASEAYESILIRDPQNQRVILEAARTYYYLGKFDKSKIYFDEVKKQKLPANVSKNIDSYLQKIDEKINKDKDKNDSFSGVFMIGLLYDSNLHNASDVGEFYIPAYENINNGVFKNNTIEEGDFAHQEILAFNHYYDFGEKAFWGLKNGFVFLNKNFFEYSDKNIQYFSYLPSFVYQEKKYKIDLGFIYDRMYFGSNKYIHTMSLYPKIEYKIDDDKILESGIKIQSKNYLDEENQNKDAGNYSLNFALKQKTSETFAISYFLSLIQERKSGGELTNVDYDAYQVGIDLSKKIFQNYSLNATFGYKNSSYKELDSQFLTKRTDDAWGLNLGLAREFENKTMAQISAGYTDNSSNIDASDYSKYIFNVNFIAPF